MRHTTLLPLLFCFSQAFAAPIRFPEHNFSIDIPTNWKPISPRPGSEPSNAVVAVQSRDTLKNLFVLVTKFQGEKGSSRNFGMIEKKHMSDLGWQIDPDGQLTIGGLQFVTCAMHSPSGAIQTLYFAVAGNEIYVIQSVVRAAKAANDLDLQSTIQSFSLLSPDTPPASDRQLAATHPSPAEQSNSQNWFNQTQKPENNPFIQALEADARKNTGDGPSSGNTRVESPIEKEAALIASEILSQAWTGLGDSWYVHTEQLGGFISNSRQTPGIFEMKHVMFEIAPLQLTVADSLNGVKWAGDLTVKSVAYRMYIDQTHQWSQWNDGTPQYMFIGERTYRLINKNGTWIKPSNPHPNVFRKLSEEEIKQAL